VLRSILIGLDGSSYSTSAIELALLWSRQFDALLGGLGIVDEPTIRQPEAVPIGGSYYKEHSDDVRLGRARSRVEQILEQFSLRCAKEGVASKVLEEVGLPYEQILVEAQRYDLIFLGQQTHFHFATQEAPCDTLQHVLKNTPRPVVTVPEKLDKGTSVLIAYDGSLQAARALQAFQATGLAMAQDIHVISVGDNHVEAARHADRAVEFLRFHDIKAQPHVLASGSTGEVLLEQVHRLHAGLLAMGAYGQSTLREFFLGSVTRSMLKKSPIPMFLYH
jgi:nucleotide-binding universal stress UspA family protein